MADYMWNPQELAQVFMLPAGVVDRALTLAGAEQLRVLLWFSRHAQQWDAAACAAALQMTVAACEGCLRFWVEQGVLTGGDPMPMFAPTPAPAEKKKAAPRTAPVKPVWQEVLRYQEEHREFSAFLEEVSARMGRPLNHSDNATLLYLITTAGMPAASVLMAVEYAVSIGKASIRYVERVVLDWADEEIITPEQVDVKLRELQQVRAAAQRVEQVLALVRPLTAAGARQARCWLYEWSFSDEMLRKAYALTMENCEKYSPAYMNKILERWHTEGITTPDKITAATTKTAKKKGVAATNPEESSLDADDFETQLLKYRPKFNKGGAQ